MIDTLFNLESSITANSFVRVFAVFVDSIELTSLGFAHLECREE